MSKLSASFKNIEDVKAAFKLLDVDGDGSISRQEMSSSGHKFSPEQVDAIFALGDVNDDGAIGKYKHTVLSSIKHIQRAFFLSSNPIIDTEMQRKKPFKAIQGH